MRHSKRLCFLLLACFSAAVLPLNSAAAGLALNSATIGTPVQQSKVPKIASQDQFLARQAISSVDISAEGKFITIGTMAFSHDANVWQFKPDGTFIAKRQFPPWAPMQAATLEGGDAMAVGLAYSRVTSPDPTV